MVEITEKDSSIVTSMMLTMVHATERAVDVLEEFFYQRYKVDNRDQLAELERSLTTKYILAGVPHTFAVSRAKREADELIRDINKDVFRNDNEAVNYGEWKKTAEKLHELTMAFTTCSMNNKNLYDEQEATPIQLFDEQMKDSNTMCRIFVLLSNIEEDDMLKVESMLKAMGTKRNESMHLLTDCFTPQIEVL